MALPTVAGADILHDLEYDTEDEFVLREVLLKAGVWLPFTVYRAWPVMLPWAVRDLRSRPTGHAQGLDEWGAPDDRGFFRDDNSLVKGLVRGLPIEGSANSLYNGRTLGTGFVAAHIWRFTSEAESFTTRDPDLYSFVPNIVWLPRALAKRSDREGGPVQRMLQALSLELFRAAPVAPQHAVLVDASWRRLRHHKSSTTPALPCETNWFTDVPRFGQARARSVRAVSSGIEQILSTGGTAQKVISSRYTAGLPQVDHWRLKELRARLAQFKL